MLLFVLWAICQLTMQDQLLTFVFKLSEVNHVCRNVKKTDAAVIFQRLMYTPAILCKKIARRVSGLH